MGMMQVSTELRRLHNRIEFLQQLVRRRTVPSHSVLSLPKDRGLIYLDVENKPIGLHLDGVYYNVLETDY